MPIKSDAQRRAVAKYDAAHYDKILLRVPKGQLEEIKAAAAGMSVNAYIRRAIVAQMERDREVADSKRYMEAPSDTVFEMLRRVVNVENLQDVSEEEKDAFLEKLKNQTEPVSCEEIYAVLKNVPGR